VTFGEQWAVAVSVGGLLSFVSIDTDHPVVTEPELSTVGVPKLGSPVPNTSPKPPLTAVIPVGQVATTESIVLAGIAFVALTDTSRWIP
jgi:hypothetical protein